MRKYQSYKSSGVEWIGEIPVDWSISKFKFLTIKEVQYGVNSSSDNYVDSGIRFIRTTDILESGILSDDGVYVEESTIPVRQLTEKYDFLISRSGTLGRTYLHLNNEKYTYGGYLVRFNFGSENISKFVDYYCKSNSFSSWITLNTIVSTIGNVNGQKYNNMEVPLPPLNYLTQIVQFLDEKTELIDKLISTKERKINLLKEERTSLVNKVITKGLNPSVKMKDSGVVWIGDIPENWKVSKLGFYTTKIGSGSTPKGGSEVYPDSGIPFIRSQNVHFDGLRLDDVSFIDIDTHISMKGSKVIKNDVLLNITGGSIGRCCIVDVEGEMNVNQHVSIIRTTFELLNYFLNYILSSDLGQSQVLFNLTGGNREGLTIDGIRNFRITIPPINEQKQIVEYLDSKIKEIDDLVSLEQRKIDTLKEYRQSLVSEVITGKIKVTID